MKWRDLNLGSLIFILGGALIAVVFFQWDPSGAMIQWNSYSAITVGVIIGLSCGLHSMHASDRDDCTVDQWRAEELLHRRHFLFNVFVFSVAAIFGSTIFTAIMISFVTTVIIAVVGMIYQHNTGGLLGISLRCDCQN